MGVIVYCISKVLYSIRSVLLYHIVYLFATYCTYCTYCIFWPRWTYVRVFIRSKIKSKKATQPLHSIKVILCDLKSYSILKSLNKEVFDDIFFLNGKGGIPGVFGSFLVRYRRTSVLKNYMISSTDVFSIRIEDN